jgi:hypothetical protein
MEKSDVSSLPDSRGPAADLIIHVEDLEAETSSEDDSNARSSVASSVAMDDSNAGVSLDEGFDLKKLLSENRKALDSRNSPPRHFLYSTQRCSIEKIEV